MLKDVLSNLPWRRQQAIVYITTQQLRAIHLRSRREVTRARNHSHPRSLVEAVAPLQQDLTHLFSDVFSYSWVKPDVILCLEGCNEGGYTPLEKDAFRSAARGAGVRHIYLSSTRIDVDRAVAVFDEEGLQAAGA
ncbi:3-methyladenine DNA glycosylase/8-oxoguanine DNA glycosylase [Litorivivens lipolytica]|uniref:3-methyladenine DNA glycosylase/8-oxoguanine DNA glycosylase n=1 Tax=Litorivivens lipolytica TaxID=1524264 RepID=A0A7W4Z5V4_9GAMM|nr:hypothetical protein [Litorivivens lipolytica]MBB3047583.1 3-methyladenine DNA glycosylase/8-oxoguanine DNA glycosylase [Litorivivens lipolytica]